MAVCCEHPAVHAVSIPQCMQCVCTGPGQALPVLGLCCARGTWKELLPASRVKHFPPFVWPWHSRCHGQDVPCVLLHRR